MKKLSVGLGVVALVASIVQAAPAEAQLKCRVDKDCEGELVCTDGTCAKADAAPKKPAVAPVASTAPAAAAPPPVKAGARENESCMSRTDCQDGLSCVDFKCTLSTAARGGEDPNLRIGFVYAPSLATSTGSKTYFPTTHNLGAELSTGGGYFRYHLTVAFSTATGVTGVRLEPVTLGVAIPILKQKGMRFEIEPTAMLLNWNFLAGSGGSIFGFSTGADVRANLAFGKFFVAASPLGFDVRYLAIATKGGAVGGGAFDYRIRLFVGGEF